MHILLFGGSFNPPHLGHQLVIEQAFELIPGLDELWLLPNFKHTFGKNLLEANHRVNLSKLLIDSLSPAIRPQVKLCTIEIDLKLSGQTYHTLQALKKKDYPESKKLLTSHQHCHFSFLMGSDQLPSFHHWGNWQLLLKQMPFFVYPRCDFPRQPLRPHMTLLTSPNQIITNISSTQIRNRLASNQPVDTLLPSTILDYINQHRLFQKSD